MEATKIHSLDTAIRKDSVAVTPAVMVSAKTHTSINLESYDRLQSILKHKQVVVDGESIDIAAVVAVARHGAVPQLDESPHCLQRINDSVALLQKCLDDGETVYGVNTGFGGSADSRSSRLADIQTALLQHHHYGVLSARDKRLSSDVGSSHAMPSDWVRAAMLVRANSVTRGHSAVTVHVIKTLVKLVASDLVPVVPLRGTISASGDLSPLSYIAGVITGNPDVTVRTSDGQLIPANEALRRIDTEPITLGPKEGLGLMNGTAPSAALASLAIYEIHHLTTLTQILTAMAVEALMGTPDSFDPFLAKVRSHRGQTEVADNIKTFLSGSQLIKDKHLGQGHRRPVAELYQDRYALRTASQWLGPQVEDLALAHEQITVELNSTTDNPLIDSGTGKIHHGGNFQAVSMTSAMEKSRMALQMMGRLMFAQTSEVINPALNHGLPANLSPDEPSTSFLMKGIDIGMASYASELGFLANPVGSHVQSAEMHNQSVNSLALISARYTSEATEIVSMMAASYLFVVCQALDLRAMQIDFFDELAPVLDRLCQDEFADVLGAQQREALDALVWPKLSSTWLALAAKDSDARAAGAVQASVADVAQFLLGEVAPADRAKAFEHMGSWTTKAADSVLQTFNSTREKFFKQQTTPRYLGNASKIMYEHVRNRLGVPFHRGLADDPTHKSGEPDRQRLTLGSWIGKIYDSLRDGPLHEATVRCCRQNAAHAGGTSTTTTNGHA